MIRPGDRLGPYRVLGRLGRGGMGEVHAAEPVVAGAGGPRGEVRRVALKVLGAGLPVASDALRRFEREAEVLARLDSPRIVRVLSGVLTEGEHRFFAMELVVGKSLGQVLDETGPIAPARAAALAAEVLSALADAHRAGVVHRDVKPSNVLVDRDGRVRLTDFGLARAADRSSMTASGSALGTPAYMSPEQARGEDAGPASDVYSAGILLYELISGRPPFSAPTPLAVLRQHLDVAPPPLAGVPAALASAVARALEKDPARRFPSAESMAAALAAAAPEDPSSEAIAPGAGAVGRGAPGSGPADETRPALEPVASAVRRLIERETVETPPAARALRPRAVASGLAALALVAALAAGLLYGPGRGEPSGPQGTPAPAAREGVQLDLRSGEALSGALVGIDGREVTIELAGGEVRRVPREAVREIRYGPRAP